MAVAKWGEWRMWWSVISTGTMLTNQKLKKVNQSELLQGQTAWQVPGGRISIIGVQAPMLQSDTQL